MKKHVPRPQSLLKNNEFIYCVICLLGILIILIVQYFFDSHIEEYIKLDMLTSVVVAFFLTSLASFITRIFVSKSEDVTKLTDDYNHLVKMYESNTEMLLCRNAVDSYIQKGRKTSCKRIKSDLPGDAYKIPVGDVVQLRGRSVTIFDDPTDKYCAPPFCRKHYCQLLGAHDASKIYNQTTLRVKKVEEVGNQVRISFGRSTYFDALVSNRAIDFKIGGLCVRDLYAHGPFLSSLSDSKLSNHMGFNGMVETSDGKFIFVKRHKKVSIGKKTMQCSIAASLKAKYAVNKSGIITKERIAHAIMKEIEDELSLSEIPQYSQKQADIFGDFSFEKNVLYFYRDLLEGGKPQLMFYAKLNVPYNAIETAYTATKQRKTVLKDGNKIKGIDREALRKVYLAPDEMVINNQHNKAMPSAVATVIMLKNAMSHGLLREDIQESFLISKKGDQATNEDALYVDDRFIAVIDGVTAKSASAPGATMSSGRFAAQTICDLLAIMPDKTEPAEILAWLNDHLKNSIAASVFSSSEECPMASLLLYDSHTKTVISYGDCQALLRGKVYKREKPSDKRFAEERAKILRAELSKGVSQEALLKNDIGRAHISEELLSHSLEHANKAGSGGFPVLGKGEIIPEYIDVYAVSSGETVVLASDGYPYLAETLSQSEENLQRIISEDPLLIREYQATKGVATDNISYDDRTYIRFVVK